MRSNDWAECELADFEVLAEVEPGGELATVRVRRSCAVDCAELYRALGLEAGVAAADHRVGVVAVLRVAGIGAEVEAIALRAAAAVVVRVAVIISTVESGHEVIAPAVVGTHEEPTGLVVVVLQAAEIR